MFTFLPRWSFNHCIYALVFCIAGAIIGLACFIPLNLDDVQYIIASSRAGYDGWVNTGVWVLCQHNFNTPIPLLLLPGRALAWALYYPVSTPTGMRFYGVITFVIWMGVVSRMIQKSLAPADSWGQVLVMVIACSFLGVAPFLPVFMRGETLMAVTVAFYVLVPFYLEKAPLKKTSFIIVLGVFFLISSWFFSAHPKSLIFAPLALYSLWVITGKRIGRWVNTALLLAIIIEGYNFWIYRLTCPESEHLRDHIDAGGLQPHLLLQQPYTFMGHFFYNLTNSPHYLTNILFTHYGLRNNIWLPHIPLNAAHTCADFLIEIAIMAAMAFCVWAVFLRMKNIFGKRIFSPNCVIPFLLLISIACMAGLQNTRAFYDTTFMWLLGVLLFILLLYLIKPLFPREFTTMAWVIVVISVLSQCVLLKSFWTLPASSLQADINGEFSNQNIYEISLAHYPERKKRILDFAVRCGIPSMQMARHVAVDMFTYLSFKESYQPIFLKQFFIEDMDHRLLPFLKEKQSPGLVAMCDSLPENLQNMSTRDHGLCCITRSVINASKTLYP